MGLLWYLSVAMGIYAAAWVLVVGAGRVGRWLKALWRQPWYEER